MVGRSTQISKSGQKAHPEFQEGSVVPPRGPGEVGRPTQMSERGREAQGSVGVRKPTRRSGWGRETHLKFHEGSGGATGWCREES